MHVCRSESTTILGASTGDYFPLESPDGPPAFFSVKEPVALSQMLTLINFPSFFIQRGRQPDPTSASIRRETNRWFLLLPPGSCVATPKGVIITAVSVALDTILGGFHTPPRPTHRSRSCLLCPLTSLSMDACLQQDGMGCQKSTLSGDLTGSETHILRIAEAAVRPVVR